YKRGEGEGRPRLRGRGRARGPSPSALAPTRSSLAELSQALEASSRRTAHPIPTLHVRALTRLPTSLEGDGVCERRFGSATQEAVALDGLRGAVRVADSEGD